MTFVQMILLLVCLSLAYPTDAQTDSDQHIRVATFNIAMGLKTEGDLFARLQSGQDEALQKVAAVIQQVRPDVLLLNEFDWSEQDSAALFIRNYLESSQLGNEAITYAYNLTDAVNTGVDSGLDLDRNGSLGDPADAWGFGAFPGQYGMLVLSRFPLKLTRSFRFFKWVDMPNALFPVNADGTDWYPPAINEQLRLSSKSHWDIVINLGAINPSDGNPSDINTDTQKIHFLVSHPTPPVFDGPEDRNGRRNHDEIRLWADYVDPEKSAYIYDDAGKQGGLPHDARFLIAGDLNSDPQDGDSHVNAIKQLLNHDQISRTCKPVSKGAIEASEKQAGKNLQQHGDPATDTGDFNDKYTGNMRIDYVLPSANLEVVSCGVFWPASDEQGHELVDVSDHHLVWVEVKY